MDYVLVLVMHAKILYPGITLTQMLSSEQIFLQYIKQIWNNKIVEFITKEQETSKYMFNPIFLSINILRANFLIRIGVFIFVYIYTVNLVLFLGLPPRLCNWLIKSSPNRDSDRVVNEFCCKHMPCGRPWQVLHINQALPHRQGSGQWSVVTTLR